jgi:citryl-CoA lyase
MAKTVKHINLNAFWGEKDHLKEAQKKSFSAMVFESLVEREPNESELKLFDLILNLSIDHGEETPSAIPLIEAAKTGKTISESLAAGILQINDRHGGAVEPAMKFFYKVENETLTDAQLKDLVADYLTNKKIIGGFGHRIYKDSDPRTELIFKTLKENNLGEEFIQIAQRVQNEIAAQKGVKLPINIDGAIAVVLCTFGWEAKLGNAVFIIARTPGLIAHFLNNS